MNYELYKKYLQLPIPVRAGIWFTVCNFLQKGISFITIPIFIRLMTKEEYGIYNIYLSWYNFLVIFGTLHLSYFVFDKGLVKFEDKKNLFTVSIQSLSFTLTVILLLFYCLTKTIVDTFIHIPSSMMVCIFLQLFFEPPILYWTARKRFEYEYKSVLFVTLILSVLNPTFGILFIKLGLFSSTAFARAFSVVIVSIIFGTFIGGYIINRANIFFSTKYWKYALCFNVPLIPHFLSTTVLASADRIMIGDMVGIKETAIYSLANSVGLALTLFSQAIHHAYLPWLYKRIKKEEYAGLAKISHFLLLGMLIIVISLICLAPEIVLFVGSAKYKDAIWIIPPICASVFFITLRDLFANVEYYFEKTKLISMASIIVAVLNVILNYIFIKEFGYLAAGYTTLFCYIVLSFVHYMVMKYLCNLNHIESKVFFNAKIILLLSGFLIAIVPFMYVIYQHLILRYLLISIILIGLFLCRNHIYKHIRIFR